MNFQKTKIRDSSNEIVSQFLKIAIPVSLQSILTSSFALVDQIMIGNLGTTAIAAVGFASKIAIMFTMLMGAISSTIQIMVSQYYGKKDTVGISKSFFLNTYYSLIILAIFIIPILFFPEIVIRFFTKDAAVIPIAADYLRIIGISFISVLGVNVFAPLFRNIGYSRHLLYISFSSLIINIILNYIFIFGKLGLPEMGIHGAAIATLISKIAELICIFLLYLIVHKKNIIRLSIANKYGKAFQKKTLAILLPMAASQLLWSIGEATYAAIYGRMSSENMAAMSIINPLQSMTMALFIGFATAAGIIVGNCLGNKNDEKAYKLSAKFLKYAVVFCVLVTIILFSISGLYPKLFNVPTYVASSSSNLIKVFGIFTTVKVIMSVVSQFIRSGGKTKYIAIVDLIGIFLIGIPIGFVSAFVWNMPIQLVYALISIEELIRLTISLFIWRSKHWIRDITQDENSNVSKQVKKDKTKSLV